MFEQLKDGLCPSCRSRLDMDFTFHTSAQMIWKTFKIKCKTCNYFAEGDNTSYFVLLKENRDEAIKETYNPDGSIMRIDPYTLCPANLYPEYELPDGSHWVRRFMDLKTLEKLTRPYPID